MNNNPSTGSGQVNAGNGFFSGFLLGLLVGAAVVFLLATKKGKRILEVISKEGIDNISDFLSEAEKIEEPRKTPLRPAERDFAGQGEKAIETPRVKLNTDKSFIESPRPKVRRFFRGISRHLN